MLVVGPLRFYPSYTNGVVLHATFFSFFFSLIIAWIGIWQFFFFFPIFVLKQPDFREKKFFLLSGQGVYPPYTLSGPTTKKNIFHFTSIMFKHFRKWCWPSLPGRLMRMIRPADSTTNGSPGTSWWWWWLWCWWIDLLIDWFMNWWSEWLIDWLMNWLLYYGWIGLLIDWLIDWLINGLIDWLINF